MLSLFVNVAARATLIGASTASILWALRIRTPTVRHLAWTTVLIMMLLLPIWWLAGPKIPLAVLAAPPVSFVSGSRADSDQSRLAHQPSATRPGPITHAAPAGNRSARDGWEAVLIGAYVLGALALLIRLAIGTVHAHRLRRGAVMRAGLATSARCATPITVGWLSPVVILPDGWERWPAAQLDAALIHEHEHARRHDPLVQWFALLNRAILWFHPLAWWLDRRLATLAEEACDAAVIRAGHSPQDYSGYLIDMARVLRRQGKRLNVAGMAMPGSGLQDRMRHLLEEAPVTALSRTRVIATLAFCTTSSVMFAAGVLAPPTSAVAPFHTSAIAPGRDIALVAPPPNAPVPAIPIPTPPAPDASEKRHDPNSQLKPELEMIGSAHDYKVGLYYYRIHWYPGAVDRFKKVLENDPVYPNRDSIYYYLGEICHASKQDTEALRYYERVVKEFAKSDFLERAKIRIAELQPPSARTPTPTTVETPTQFYERYLAAVTLRQDTG
jgi:hypothetical protein